MQKLPNSKAHKSNARFYLFYTVNRILCRTQVRNHILGFPHCKFFTL